MRILFTGGGTMGSVVPLLAVIEVLKDKDPSIDFYWLGTRQGPEEKLIRNYNIEFRAIASGKLRRYFSLLNFLDIFKFLAGLIESILILRKWKPQVIVAAGSFASVPVVWAGWLLGIPSLIHQQDVRPGLANKLCAGFAQVITVCFESTAEYFSAKKRQVVGNPVRAVIRHTNTQTQRQELLDKFKLNDNLPVVLVMGGGRGAKSINELTIEALPELVKFCQIIHILGQSQNSTRLPDGQELKTQNYENYHQYEFLTEGIEALSAVDLIVSRAGMGSLTEIAYLKKPAIVIPIPGSHQKDNAYYFYERGAIIALEQTELNKDKFIKIIKETLTSKRKMKELGEKVHQAMEWGAEEKIADLILGMVK